MTGEPDEGMTPTVHEAFAALRAEMEPPRDPAMAAARAAMHDARLARQRPRPSLWDLRHRLTPRRLALGGGALASGLAALMVLGWNAPAGSPLHAVRVAREQVALAVPGVDRTGLELSDAEARLEDAAHGTNPAASLDEAERLLADARTHLPADHASALWTRWQNDMARLDDLREGHDDGGRGGPAPGGTSPSGQGDGGPVRGGGADGDGSSTPDDGGGGGSASGSGGSSQSSTAGTSTSTSTSSRDGGGSSSTSTTTSSTSSDGGGGGSSSSTSSSSTSDGGSGGGSSSASGDGSGH